MFVVVWLQINAGSPYLLQFLFNLSFVNLFCVSHSFLAIQLYFRFYAADIYAIAVLLVEHVIIYNSYSCLSEWVLLYLTPICKYVYFTILVTDKNLNDFSESWKLFSKGSGQEKF